MGNRVLIIEDEPSMQKEIIFNLNKVGLKGGLDYLLVEHSSEALREIQTGNYRVLSTDCIHLGQLDLISLLETARNRNMKTVLLTGLIEEAGIIREARIKRLVDAYFSKSEDRKDMKEYAEQTKKLLE